MRTLSKKKVRKIPLYREENWEKQVLNDPETVFESLENSYREIRRSPTDFNKLIDLLNVLSDGKIGLIKK